ncbi:MAG: hypothetical protein H0V04_00785 [Chloroflexi bacterium]|nr:hypothetical protein [Chloroflexota bacterium]
MDDKDRDLEREAADVPDAPSPEAEDDTEGHSLFQAELHRTIATSRAKEASAWARGESARRAAEGRAKRDRR